MRCEHHPGVPATAKCEICEIPICGVCSNYTAKAVLCDRCVNSVAMSELFAARTTGGSTSGSASTRSGGKATIGGKGAASRGAGAGAGRATSMSNLLEEGKSLNLETAAEGPTRKPRSKMFDLINVVGIFVCFIVIGVQLYSNFGAASSLNSTQIVDEELRLDRVQSCVQVFWQIAEVLKRDQIPSDSLSCSFPGSPNIVARVNDDIIVRHPSPTLLGYSDISVSKSNPIPVLLH